MEVNTLQDLDNAIQLQLDKINEQIVAVNRQLINLQSIQYYNNSPVDNLNSNELKKSHKILKQNKL